MAITSPEVPTTKNDFDISQTSDIILMQGNTLTAHNIEIPKTQVLGVITNYEVARLIAMYDWDFTVAYAVMFAESSGNANAINWKDRHSGCRGSFGYFQLACFRGTQEELLNPETNVRLAYELWKKEGWKPWGAYTSGKYKRYLR